MNKLLDRNRRVLVIDDNRAIHDDFRKILSPLPGSTPAFDAAEAALFGTLSRTASIEPFEIDSAYQGEEGVSLSENALKAGLPYAVAFVDVRMPPGWDGLETAQKLWELDPDLQIVFCTAYSDHSWGEMSEKLGHCNGWLVLKKPFDTVEAVQLAHALTEKWWLHQQSRRKMEELESLVAERTGDLRKTSAALAIEVADHERAEATLRASEEKFRQLADNITEVFYITSPDMQRMDYVSPAYEQIWGHSTESLYANPLQWADAIVPEERERVYIAFSKLGSSDPRVSMEFRIVRPDGTVRWIHTRGFQARDPTGKVIRIAGIASDITQRKEAQLTSNRLAAIVECSDDAIIGKNLSGVITSWNKGAEKLFGYAATEMEGTTIRRLIPADRQVEENQFLEKLNRGESVEHFETLRQTKDGRLIDVSVVASPIRDDNGKVIGVSKVVRDITERKRAEKALQISEASMAVAQRIAHLGSWELELANPDKDSAGKLSWSDEMFRIAGFESGTVEVSNELFFRLVPTSEHDAIRQAVASAIRERRQYSIIHRIIRPDGGERIVQEEGQVFFDEPSGRPLRIIGTAHDITERKHLEAQLFQSQRLEIVGKLAGGVAHEFNSILTAIIGHTDLMLRDLPAGNALSRNAAEIRQSAERAATLTRQLLAYGRKQLLRPEIFDLNAVIAGMESMFRHVINGAIDVRVVPAAGLRSVKADVGQIEQVILNIVMNASDAMPNGGKLTLETANVRLDELSIGRDPELKPGDYVMLAITDTGAGMTDEVKARLFEPFFTTKGVGQGTGLGLSTCYGIIKQSGGHISVYSELGRGASFKIYLAQVEPEALLTLSKGEGRGSSPDGQGKGSGRMGEGAGEEKEGPARGNGLPRGTETILLVEDDPALREMAAALLRRLGYTVLAAANGIEALSLKPQRDRGHIDLLFTDVVMPHMSGSELSDRVRARNPHTRILFTSGYTENAIVHQGVLDEGVALLQKPFTPSALAHKLREVLDQTNAPKPAAVLPLPKGEGRGEGKGDTRSSGNVGYAADVSV